MKQAQLQEYSASVLFAYLPDVRAAALRLFFIFRFAKFEKMEDRKMTKYYIDTGKGKKEVTKAVYKYIKNLNASSAILHTI